MICSKSTASKNWGSGLSLAYFIAPFPFCRLDFKMRVAVLSILTAQGIGSWLLLPILGQMQAADGTEPHFMKFFF